MKRGSLTWQEKHAHVLAYLACPYGTKGAYLREHGLSAETIRSWRSQVYAGSLEQGLVPRGGVLSSVEENQEIVRLAQANEALRQQLAAQQDDHETALAAKDAEIARAASTVEALGKAIALLQVRNESADGTTGH